MRINSIRCDVPLALYRAEQVRQLDALAIARTEGGGYALMCRAGKAAFRVLRHEFPGCESISVVCGGGNNGGDGYVVAELALAAGFKVQLLAVSDPDKLTGEAQQAWQKARTAGVVAEPWHEEAVFSGELIVDALLGTGLTGEVRVDFAAVIRRMNLAVQPVLAIDIPSGLAADTGVPLGPTVKAAATVTFIGIKQGLLTGQACDFTGELWFDDLDVPADIYTRVTCAVERTDLRRLRKQLPAREKSSHKNHYGHVLIIGGEQGYGGAAILAAEAALLAGAGLVSCATQACHVMAGLARQPGIMYRDAGQRPVLLEMISKADVLVLGPGLGNQPWGQMCFQAGLDSGLPLVLDADGLNLLARQPLRLPANSVLTPHPGEAARLLHTEVAEITSDRFTSVQKLSEEYGCSALLKGFGTLISSPSQALQTTEVRAEECATKVLCGHGNPGMAKGGMGDVLAGVIGALLGQGLSGFAAAQLGACWHAAAADHLVGRCGETSLVASNLPQVLGEVLVAVQ